MKRGGLFKKASTWGILFLVIIAVLAIAMYLGSHTQEGVTSSPSGPKPSPYKTLPTPLSSINNDMKNQKCFIKAFKGSKGRAVDDDAYNKLMFIEKNYDEFLTRSGIRNQFQNAIKDPATNKPYILSKDEFLELVVYTGDAYNQILSINNSKFTPKTKIYNDEKTGDVFYDPDHKKFEGQDSKDIKNLTSAFFNAYSVAIIGFSSCNLKNFRN